MPAAAVIDPVDVSRIERDFAAFERLLSIGEEFQGASNPRAAAACAEIAAACAWRNHPGLFASGRLERLVEAVAQDALPIQSGARTRARTTSPRHILHVMSKARRMGGDSRFVCRWIHNDGGRRHSIAITTQLDEEIPQAFLDATVRVGGAVHALDAGTRDPILRARRLRALAESVDLVVLHLYPDDIVPLLAFAGVAERPPIAFVNHSDHTFWLGVGITDLLVQLRACSVLLSTGRRHVEPKRLVTLPIPLLPAERRQSRADAKAQLGLSAETTVLLSVGTGFKYRRVGGHGFLDVLRPIVETHPGTALLVVGPRPNGEWAEAQASTGGRIVPLGPRYDTASLFEAADVYLDSFPFTSPTAALEAGTYALPIIAFCPRRGDARVLCPGAPGLDDSMCRRNEVHAYQETVERFIANPDLRRQFGDLARRNIEYCHMGPRWAEQLEDVYRAAADATPATVTRQRDECSIEEVDVIVNGLYTTGNAGVGGFIDQYVRPLPYATRVAVLRRLVRVNRSFSLQMFIPGRVPSWRPPGWSAFRRLIPIGAR